MSLDDAGTAAGAAASPRPPKLPFWRTVFQAYALWVRNLPDLVRTCWLWLLLLAPFLAIEAWRWAPQYAAILKEAARGVEFPPDPTPLLSVAAKLMILLLTLPAAASIAVAWHRLVLRAEHPGSSLYLRLDSVVGVYALLLAATWLPGRASGLLMAVVGGGVAVWLFSAFAFVLLFVLPRLSLALPAAAVQRGDVTFRVSWQATRRNTWRMFWATYICFLPAGLIGQLLAQFLPPEPDRITMTLLLVALYLLGLPLSMIPVGLLSLAYRHFFERGEEEAVIPGRP
jgi:hypothetical protein